MNIFVELIDFLTGLPVGVLWGLMLVAAFCSIVLMARIFGELGLYVYIVLAVVGANVQVLKAVDLPFYDAPVGLGTVLFGTVFLANDALNELYGAKAARRGVVLGFFGMLLMVVFAFVTLSFEPTANAEYGWARENHEHMWALFVPAPSLFVASLTAYFASQYLDIWVYRKVFSWSGDRWLWLRNNVSTILAGFVDNVIFSVLAWQVLAVNRLEWGVVWETYIWGAFGIRVLVGLLDTPILYWLKGVVGKKKPLF